MRRVLLLVLVLSSLVACSDGVRDIDYHTGTEGIAISFEADTPPPEVYEYSSVPLYIRLTNKGAFDVPYDRIFFTLLGDAFYTTIEQDPLLQSFETEQGQNWPSGDDPIRRDYDYTEEGVLYGRQPGYDDGDFVELHPYLEIREITGLREEPSTQLYASVCYPYRTVLGTSLCVDANAFNGNQQHQVCSAETISLQDQGAPVAVVRVENRPSPIRVDSAGGRGYRDIVQPTFVLHVKNIGTGTVLAVPSDDVEGMVAACAMRIPREELNGVAVRASLSSLNLTCEPETIYLRDGEGFTTCTLLPKDGTVIDAPNYVGTLKVTLDYLYRDSIARDIAIIRRPEGFIEGEFTNDERDSNPGFVNGVSRCEYCSGSSGGSECAGWPEDAAPGAYSCSCGEQQCLRGARDEPPTCVYGQTWCPGTNYCCKT